jgi:hypothetical protein
MQLEETYDDYIFQSTEKFLFGGYTKVPWSSTVFVKGDADAFLFTFIIFHLQNIQFILTEKTTQFITMKVLDPVSINTVQVTM